MPDECKKLDEIDIKIIGFLQKNARITASEIAQCISMSVPAVSERIRKLEQSGIICGYCVLLDPIKLNRSTTAFSLVSLDRTYDLVSFTETIAGEPEILEFFCTTGQYDCFLKIMTQDTTTLKAILERIKGHPGVSSISTHIVLSTNKFTLPITFE